MQNSRTMHSSSRPKKQAKAKPKKQPRSHAPGMGMSSGLMKPTSTPQGVSVGVVIPQSMFKFEGKAQALTEVGGMGDSIRCCGTDLFASPVKAGSTNSAAGFGGTATFWQALTPSGISPRLTALEGLFQFYAIRELQILYSPEVATSKSVSVCIGLLQDIEADGDSGLSAPTQQELLELTPAMKTAAYQPASITYRHTGTRIWSTTQQSSAVYEGRIQAAIGAALTGADLATSLQLGSLWLSFVIDFYKPSPVIASVARLERQIALLKLRQSGHFSGLPQWLQKSESRLHKTEEFKAESSDSELVELQPVPFVRSGNSVLRQSQDPSFTPANTPAGSKNSVKSLSLK